MVSYVSKLAAKTAPHFGKLNLSNIIAYTPNLLFWSGASWAGLFVFTEGWPLFQDTFFKKVPVFGTHWVKTVDPEDSPQ
ncbi:LAFA_0F08350g1_1 [Lachancea sp. 'fantastica']|nr:LAFA_0F08350g1_1 [Lachancea sp. 'fantastica']